MTQDEIIEMARQVGMDYIEYISEDSMKQVEAFAKLVAAKAFQNGYEKGIAGFNEAVSLEREACAKVCEEIAQESDSFTESILRATATQIRARGEQA